MFVRGLVRDQFPRWADLQIRPVVPGGWDNRCFRLGDDLVVRLPRAQAYAPHVEKEQRWLPVLARELPLAVPVPLAAGGPGRGYPWSWSVYRWIEGASVADVRGIDLPGLAAALARFLVALERIDATGGPGPGPHSFHRGGSLSSYDAEARAAMAALKGRIDLAAATGVWEAGLAAAWTRPAVWVHGDVSPANLLVRDGRLCAVIDFGLLAAGDPACDLSIAWTLFEGPSRSTFRSAMSLDDDTWARARAWTLWKAVIVAAGLAKTNAAELAQPWRIIEDLLAR